VDVEGSSPFSRSLKAQVTLGFFHFWGLVAAAGSPSITTGITTLAVIPASAVTFASPLRFSASLTLLYRWCMVAVAWPEMARTIRGEAVLTLTISGTLESNGSGGTQRAVGTTKVTGTVTSGDGEYRVDLTI
jgi:hypothetical protein